MTNELRVFYDSARGLMTFDNKKTIFQHRSDSQGVKKGLGTIDFTRILDKGNFAFARFQNVQTVIPTNYADIRFFNNRGVPTRIETGVYGDNVLLKEEYRDRTYIRAYKTNGDIGLYECRDIHNNEYTGPNIYFCRINELISSWKDITDRVVTGVIKSIDSLTSTVTVSNETVYLALRGLVTNPIYQLSSGVIIAEGKYESLVIWDEQQEVKMAWTGCKLDLSTYEKVDISEKVKQVLAAM